MQLFRASTVHTLKSHELRGCRPFTLCSTNLRFIPSFDPYSYTQGRWLDRDAEKREARTLHFEFDALLDVAITSSKGARKVVSCDKREGGFNRIFIIELDNTPKIIAKLPTRLAGPSGLTISSEVATLQYMKEKTNVPIPSGLAWSLQSETNAVGTEYMITEIVPGVALKDVWGQMTALQHIKCIESLGSIANELCQLNFGTYGSLYLNTMHISQNVIPLDDTYCIGPHCGRQHWGCGVGTSGAGSLPEGTQGPWQNLEAYFASLTKIAESTVSRGGPQLESTDNHLKLLDHNQSVSGAIKDLPAVQDASNPVLFHPDFHARNIFVAVEDPTRITGIIDWQSTAVEPAFVYAAETPDIAEELHLDETLDADRGSDMDAAQADTQRCNQTWAVLAFSCPKLGKATTLDPLLLRYLSGISSGYLDDAVALRTSLTDLRQRWESLSLPGKCPLQPSRQELETWNEELDELRSTQRLKMYLSRLLRCEMDGWVETERWEEVVTVYREEYRDFIEACIESRDEGETEVDAKRKAERLWPFDLR